MSDSSRSGRQVSKKPTLKGDLLLKSSEPASSTKHTIDRPLTVLFLGRWFDSEAVGPRMSLFQVVYGRASLLRVSAVVQGSASNLLVAERRKLRSRLLSSLTLCRLPSSLR